MSFKEDFVWGVATASYQIEGGANEDGRGPTTWDMFCRKPGAVKQGDTGDVACDHYHRYPEDVQLMKELGVGAYRFSLAWSRILPDGTGQVEPRGVAFYDRLVDALLEAGIDPWVTLFHWDHPLALYHRGGWLNPDAPNWFADYASVVVDALSDRVTRWMTLNEPQCFIGLGLHLGVHAPGDKLRWAEVLGGIHNSLLAHGRAVQVIRARAKRPPLIGMAPTGEISIPHTNSQSDVDAARARTFAVTSESGWHMGWWLDPVFLGKYPADGLKLFGGAMPSYTDEDMAVISEPLDFFGVNIYHGERVRAADAGPVVVPYPTSHPATALKWPVAEESLYWASKFFHERYGKPIVITENGMAGMDWPALDGKVHDPGRIDFLHRYIGQLKRAAADGVPIDGYFQWSLMDNFEWAEGYRERFGLIYVDYETQERIPKDSYHWYKNTVATNARDL